jgi:hypothetical protein
MIRHQDISMNPAAGFTGIFLEPLQIKAAILIRKKTGLPVISALDQMHRNVWERKTSTTRHGI